MDHLNVLRTCRFRQLRPTPYSIGHLGTAKGCARREASDTLGESAQIAERGSPALPLNFAVSMLWRYTWRFRTVS